MNAKSKRSKTKVGIFYQEKTRKKFNFVFGDNEFEVVTSYKYLGLTLNYNDKFTRPYS